MSRVERIGAATLYLGDARELVPALDRVAYSGGCADCGTACNKQAMRCLPCANTHRALYSQGGKSDSVSAAEAGARSGCNALLRAHLTTGKHWITEPARFADAVASVAK